MPVVPNAIGTPIGYTWDVDKTLHVVYLGNDNHLHELYYRAGESRWNYHDLTVDAWAPLAKEVPTAYIWDVDKTPHVIYIGQKDNHLYELSYQAGERRWNYHDLTAMTNALPAAFSPAAFTCNLDKTQHIIYAAGVGQAFHLCELSYQAEEGRWSHNHLALSTISTPAGYISEANKTQHIIYHGREDNRLHELSRRVGKSHWHDNDLTVAAQAPEIGLFKSPLTAYSWEMGKMQHVIYFDGMDNHIHELYCRTEEGRWNHRDLTANAHAPKAVFGSLAGYTWDVENTQHVFYLGIDSHIHELSSRIGEGCWNDRDLITATHAPEPISNPTAITWDVENTCCVFYLGIDNHIHELSRRVGDDRWSHRDLTRQPTN